MNKRLKRNLEPFRRIQQANGQYHISQLSPHERAIKEHIQRGFESGLARVAGLLDQRNKI